MLKSMTGYGKAVKEVKNKRITIEIKSLNSKNLDMSTRIPGYYREKELEIRSAVGKALDRGKVDFSLFVEVLDGDSGTVINKPVILNYVKQIQAIANENSIDEPADYFNTILRLPDTLKTEVKEIDEAEWEGIKEALQEAISQLIEFRSQEGRVLQEDISKRIHLILEALGGVEVYEKERIEIVKTRLYDGLSDLSKRVDYDKNRFEQELIFYLEKLDITEEKVRLKNHCDYFLENINSELPIGKKLGFISQEIGREINTIGSKANHSELQKLVIRMKDELEKIKEQTLNVL